MFIINAAGPVAGQTMLQGLRLSSSFKGRALDFLDQLVDPFEHFSVGALPIQVVLQSVFGKDKLHPDNSRSVPPSEANSAIDSMSLRAFFGLLRRKAVSSRAS